MFEADRTMLSIGQSLYGLGQCEPGITRTALFVLSGDPWCKHHSDILRVLRSAQDAETRRLAFDEIIVWIIGAAYPERRPYEASPEQRLQMCERAVASLPAVDGTCKSFSRIVVRDDDVKTGNRPSNWGLQLKLVQEMRSDVTEEEYPGMRTSFTNMRQLWHFVGSDNVPNINRWDNNVELMERLRWLIGTRGGFSLRPDDLPRKHVEVDLSLPGSGSKVVELVRDGLDWEHLVPISTAAIIKANRLYGYRP